MADVTVIQRLHPQVKLKLFDFIEKIRYTSFSEEPRPLDVSLNHFKQTI